GCPTGVRIRTGGRKHAFRATCVPCLTRGRFERSAGRAGRAAGRAGRAAAAGRAGRGAAAGPDRAAAPALEGEDAQMVAVDLDGSAAPAMPPPRSPGRPPGSVKGPVPITGGKAKMPSKADLVGLLGTANFTIQLAGLEPQMALTTEEVERLAESLLELLRQ